MKRPLILNFQTRLTHLEKLLMPITKAKYNPELPLDEQTEILAYDSQWEFAGEDLIMGIPFFALSQLFCFWYHRKIPWWAVIFSHKNTSTWDIFFFSWLIIFLGLLFSLCLWISFAHYFLLGYYFFLNYYIFLGYFFGIIFSLGLLYFLAILYSLELLFFPRISFSLRLSFSLEICLYM